MKVKQWCQVTHGSSGLGISGRLYTREVEMGALPNEGELSCIGLYTCPDPEDLGEDGYMASVKRRYWNSDGTANLELFTIHIDPVGPLLEELSRPREVYDSTYWGTDVDRDPVPAMLASGWIEYKP